MRYADIPGYEGLYVASDRGEIISLPRATTKGGVLKPYVNKHNGYCCVNLSKNNRRTTKRVHHLVMMAFNPISESAGLEIDHIDRNKENNSLENLEWVTHTENIRRRVDVNYYSIPVIDLDTGEVFSSEVKAAQSVGGKKGNAVHRVCTGERNHYKGHRFAFYGRGENEL